MKAAQYFQLTIGQLGAACLLAVSATCACADLLDEDGPTDWQERHVEPAEIQVLEVSLPDYPVRERLLELAAAPAGFPYRVYIDPDSISTGADRVARYTVVLISDAGVWNVSYEGLRCGERSFRRFAYGSGGEWHELGADSWTRISGRGANRYRKMLYDDYMCDVAGANPDAGTIVRRLRTTRPVGD